MRRTESDWMERFGDPLKNAATGSTLFETYGADLEAVHAADPLTVWTVVEGSETENQYLLPGFHRVNRIGYVLSSRPIAQEELASGEWDEVLWVDEAEMYDDVEDGPAP